MAWYFFLLLLTPIVAPIAMIAIQEQRWFKKILFYYFPKVLRPLSYKLKPINVYYSKLTPEERKRFEWRAYYFLNTTSIEFRNFEGTKIVNFNAIRYLIASVATQMSLFLSEDSFDAFHRIIIYPEDYVSPVANRKHKGETNPAAGYIVLSLKSLKQGFATREDGINLLMHELAHALWLENQLFDYDIFEPDALARYLRIANAEMDKLQDGGEHFLRKYAATNREEFFAVAIENFFERPDEFQTELPQLYSAMVYLLKQDPIKLEPSQAQEIKTQL